MAPAQQCNEHEENLVPLADDYALDIVSYQAGNALDRPGIHQVT
jgi:hypothetical protein